MDHVPVLKLSSNSFEYLPGYPSMIHILLVVSPWFSITVSRFNKDSPTLTIIHQHEPLFTNFLINHLTMIHHLTINHHIPLSPYIDPPWLSGTVQKICLVELLGGERLCHLPEAVAISWVSLRWCHGNFFTIPWKMFMENYPLVI